MVTAVPLTSQRQIHKLENPAQKGQETGGEDEDDDGSEGDGGSSRLFPLAGLA